MSNQITQAQDNNGLTLSILTLKVEFTNKSGWMQQARGQCLQ
jgi:hypothetical protein